MKNSKLQKYIEHERSMAVKSSIKSLNPKNKIILDFGCSGGQYANIFLQESASYVYCYDAFKEPLEFAKEYLKGHKNQTTISDIGMAPDNSIDIFFARLSLPYVNIYNFFEEVDKKVKLGGLVYIRYHAFSFYKKYFFQNPIRSTIGFLNYSLMLLFKKRISIKIKKNIFNDTIYTRASFAKFKNYSEVSFEKLRAPIIILKRVS